MRRISGMGLGELVFYAAVVLGLLSIIVAIVVLLRDRGDS
jgi:hypothetical protein